MLVTTLALVAVTPLSIVFAETRLIGVLGIALLVYLHPLSLLVVAVSAGVVAVVRQLNRRRSRHALPAPDPERD